MRPQTFVGVLGLLIAVGGGFVLDQASDGSGAVFVPLILGIIMMAVAWWVRWPGDSEEARAARRARRDEHVRGLARRLGR